MLIPRVGVALPIIKSLPDTGLVDLTVTPFVPQLYELPHQVLESISSWNALKALYLTTNPLISGFALSLFISPIFLIVSEVNRNYSQVDRCWSLLPTLYITHFRTWAHLVGLPTYRLDLVLAVSILWSCRLTFNYWRRGGYEIGSEDYRWEVLKKQISRPLFFILNLTFISFIQNVLLFLIASPAYIFVLASQLQGDEKSPLDMAFVAWFVLLIVAQFIADQQQWNFQENKKLYLKTAKVPNGFEREDLDRGFLVRGLWAWSRHPNVLIEQAIWVSLYEWSSLETQQSYNWTGIGALSFVVLLHSSTLFTEAISASKYPDYKEYQKRVSMFLPKISTAFTGPVADAKPIQSPKEQEQLKKNSRKSR